MSSTFILLSPAWKVMKWMDRRNRNCRDKQREGQPGVFPPVCGLVSIRPDCWVLAYIIRKPHAPTAIFTEWNGLKPLIFHSPAISFPAAASFPYSVPLTTLDLLTSAISSNSTSSSLSVPGCVPLRSRFCSGSITHTRKGTSALCYSFLPQASSLISSYSQSSFFQVKYFFYI